MTYTNDELGLVVAENEDEKFYMDIEKDCKTNIANIEKQLRFNREIMEMAQRKLAELNEKYSDKMSGGEIVDGSD